MTIEILKIFPFPYYLSSKVCWIRISSDGYGLSLKNTRLLFSEKYGYRKSLKLPFGWRLMIIRPIYPKANHKRLNYWGEIYNIKFPRFTSKKKKKILIRQAIEHIIINSSNEKTNS